MTASRLSILWGRIFGNSKYYTQNLSALCHSVVRYSQVLGSREKRKWRQRDYYLSLDYVRCWSNVFNRPPFVHQQVFFGLVFYEEHLRYITVHLQEMGVLVKRIGAAFGSRYSLQW